MPCLLYYVSAVEGENPDGFLLIADNKRHGLFWLNVTGGPQQAILHDLPSPRAVDYDPVHKYIIWSDFSKSHIGKYPLQIPNGASFFKLSRGMYV